MKNFLVFFIVIMLICFVTPNLFLTDVLAFQDIDISSSSIIDIFKRIGEKIGEIFSSRDDGEIEEDDKKDFEIPNYKDNIRLLLKNENKVIELKFDDYIKGVLIGEMPVSYEIEALKAQALVARTYTLYKLKNAPNAHENADMCDDIMCCQCYKTKEYAFDSWDDEGENEKWLKIEEAVETTSNQCITYNNEIIAAFFHANSGGKTEDVRYIWNGDVIDYLKSVDGFEKDYDEEIKLFSGDEFEKIMRKKITDYNLKNDEINIIDKTPSGRVNEISFGKTNVKATELRTMLGLKSTNFTFEKDEDTIKFKTIGYGHGVGMSQVGANEMACSGESYKEIIKHYYSGVEVVNCK